MPSAESGRGSRCVRRRKWAARKRENAVRHRGLRLVTPSVARATGTWPHRTLMPPASSFITPRREQLISCRLQRVIDFRFRCTRRRGSPCAAAADPPAANSASTTSVTHTRAQGGRSRRAARSERPAAGSDLREPAARRCGDRRCRVSERCRSTSKITLGAAVLCGSAAPSYPSNFFKNQFHQSIF